MVPSLGLFLEKEIRFTVEDVSRLTEASSSSTVNKYWNHSLTQQIIIGAPDTPGSVPDARDVKLNKRD